MNNFTKDELEQIYSHMENEPLELMNKVKSMINNYMEMTEMEIFKEKAPIEIHFPLNDKDIINILKGVEYTKESMLPLMGINQRLHVKVYSSDRVKHISWGMWRKICQAGYSNPDLMNIIRLIDNGQEFDDY